MTSTASVSVHFDHGVEVDIRNGETTRYPVGSTHGVVAFVTDALVEALHKRAAGGAAILLPAGEHLIGEAATAAALAEVYAIEREIAQLRDRARRSGDDKGELMADRVLAMVRQRRAGLASALADNLKWRAQW